MRAAKTTLFVSALMLACAELSSCTTANFGTGIKADATPAPKATQTETEIAPLNETDAVTALLQPIEKLAPDTVEAALHDNKASKIPYIGAWAVDDAGCAQIDLAGYQNFAVITSKSIRQFEEKCTFSATPPTSNPTSVEAVCSAGGNKEPRAITILTTAIGGLQIVNLPGANPVEYVRCELPK